MYGKGIKKRQVSPPRHHARKLSQRMLRKHMATDHLLNHRFEMKVTDSWLHRVDEWRARQPGIPSRAEAIRRLVEQSLR